MEIIRTVKELEKTISDEEKDKKFVSKLKRSTDKVKYLRFVKHYTQEESSQIIGISKRHVQRIEKALKREN